MGEEDVEELRHTYRTVNPIRATTDISSSTDFLWTTTWFQEQAVDLWLVEEGIKNIQI